MGTVFRIFKRDLARVVTNPTALVIAIGVCLIPSAYAWINILANWNPYGNTSTVPVEVVIEDEGADVPGMGRVNAGEMIRQKLEENDQLDWRFAESADEAQDAVASGDAYAAFIIPRDFTASLAGVLDGDTSGAQVDYYVNEKANAIAPKVTDTGATELETQIASEFTKAAGEVAMDKLKLSANDAAAQIGEAAETSGSALRETADRLESLANDLAQASEAVAAARGGLEGAGSSLASVAEGAAGLSGALDGALAELASTRGAMRSLSSDAAGALASGASALAGVSSTAAFDIGSLAGDVGWAQGKLDGALAQLKALNGTVQGFLDDLEAARDTADPGAADALDRAIAALQALASEQEAALAQLEQVSADAKAGTAGVRDLADAVAAAMQAGSQDIADATAELNGTTIPALGAALDGVADAGGALAGALKPTEPQIARAQALLGDLGGTLDDTAGAAADAAESLAAAGSRMDALADEISQISRARAVVELRDLGSIDTDAAAEHLAAPAKIVDEAVFPVATYGEGVAPFYMNLALWVGGFVLVTIFKLELAGSESDTVPPRQAFLGRWLLLALMGQVQAIVCCTGAIALGVTCVSPIGLVFAGMVASAAYVLIVYTLASAFKHIGKALAVLLVVLQIPGAAGTYPIEMMPAFFQALNPWLPFTYGIGAMREAIAGFYGDVFARDLGMLALFGLAALIIGLGARKRLLPLNAFFDLRLRATDLMVADHGADGRLLTDAALIEADDPSGSGRGRKRSPQGQERLLRRGEIALIVVPGALIALACLAPAKLELLLAWICAVAVICAYLVVIDYRGAQLHSNDVHGAIAPETPKAAPDQPASGGATAQNR